jgi:hypothetical protein
MGSDVRPVDAQELADLLCGQWIDVGALDPAQLGTVVIPFGASVVRKRMIGTDYLAPNVFPHQLIVHNVRGITIEDEAKIQLYDIVDIGFASETRELTLRSSFPFVLTLTITEPSFEVRHESPEEVA